MGTLYRKQGRYGEAEKTLKRSLEVLENKLGKDHPQYAKTLDQLGSLYRELGRFEEAEKVLGPDHPSVAKAIADYGRLRLDQGKNDEAAPLFKRAFRVQEKALGPEHAAE